MVSHLPLFIATTLLMLVVPGPDFVLVTRHAIIGGRRRAYFTVVGICAGLGFLTLLSATGLAAFLAASGTLIVLLRVLGGSYLVLLGVLLLCSAVRRSERESSAGPSPDGARSSILQGFLNNVLNPKALVFYLTFLPQFMEPGHSVFIQALAMGALVVMCAAAWWLLYVTAIGFLGRALTRPTVRKWIDVGAGAALAGVGGAFLLGGGA